MTLRERVSLLLVVVCVPGLLVACWCYDGPRLVLLVGSVIGLLFAVLLGIDEPADDGGFFDDEGSS